MQDAKPMAPSIAPASAAAQNGSWGTFSHVTCPQAAAALTAERDRRSHMLLPLLWHSQAAGCYCATAAAPEGLYCHRAAGVW